MKSIEMAALAGLSCVLALPIAAQATGSGAEPAVYVAHLQPMNSKVTGLQTTGEARFTVNGDTLMIDIKVKGAPPEVEHWQHFHGFKDGHDATCATSAADHNGDGIVDLIETEAASGTTMVPFNAAPASMQVGTDTYPKAAADGSYEYKKSVPLKALNAAFAKAFDGGKVDLDRRVVYIHGVPSNTRLPASVASLGTIPAQVTLPIACGKIERSAK